MSRPWILKGAARNKRRKLRDAALRKFVRETWRWTRKAYAGRATITPARGAVRLKFHHRSMT